MRWALVAVTLGGCGSPTASVTGAWVFLGGEGEAPVEACSGGADAPFGTVETWMVISGESPESLLLYGAWLLSSQNRDADGWYTLWAELDGEHLSADTRWLQGIGGGEVTITASVAEGWMEGTASLLLTDPSSGEPTCEQTQPFQAERVQSAPEPLLF